MKFCLQSTAMIAFLLLGNTALAEGNCPPGYFPIGGQGVQGCAPMGGSSGQGSAGLPPPPPSPTGEWIKTWGALAKSRDSDLVGASNGERTKALAERVAVERCSAEGASDCRVNFTYMNQCMAYAIPVSGRGMAMLSKGPSRKDAHAEALKHCRDDSGAKCDITYSACSEPIFRKF